MQGRRRKAVGGGANACWLHAGRGGDVKELGWAMKTDNRRRGLCDPIVPVPG